MKNSPNTFNSNFGKSQMCQDSEHSGFLAIFDNSTIGMVICNLDGRFLNVNGQFAKITGYSKDELYTMTFKDITHPDDLDSDIVLIKELLEGKRKNFQLEKRYLTKEKKIIWVNLLASIVLNQESKPEAIIGTIEEISEKKQLIGELESSKSDYKKAAKLLTSIQDAIPDVIGVQDLNHNIIQYNQAGYKLLNKTYEEVVGKKCHSLIGREKQCDVCSTSEATKTKRPERHEQYFPELDTWLDMRAYPIFGENNELIYIVEHLRDITEIKKLELQLKDTIEKLQKAKLLAEESDNLKTAFLHNISHEIRTPLNGIIGFSDLLKDEGITREKTLEYSDIIIRSGWQLSNIINDLVSIATIESGQEKANLKKVDIQCLLQNVYSTFQIKARNKEITFYFKPEIPDIHFIITDETKLNQILSNLINNALKFTNAGYVELGVCALGNKLHFHIKDTGIGIKKEDHQKIFIRFAQANSNSNSLYGGSGLGLSICKSYVDLLGGRIWLDSEPDKGSTFYFEIPLVTDNQSEIIPKNEISKSDKVTILIAEDDEINFLYLSEIVNGLDINMLHAKNGCEAIALCKQEQRIDLVFMDIKMPVMDGNEATKQIKSLKPNIPIIAISAYFDEKEKDISIKAGCIAYLTKPVKKEDILEKIQKTTGLSVFTS